MKRKGSLVIFKGNQLQDGFIKGSEEAYLRIIEHLNKKNEFSLTDKVLMMMIKNLLEKVRTIQLLGKSEREESISILTRAFLELNVSLRFIIKENTNNRARSYYYNNKVQSIEKIMSMQKSDPTFDLELTENELYFLRKSVPEAENINDYKAFYEREWHEMFTPNYPENKKRNRKWYALNWEYNSFKDLMLALGIKETTYYFFYGLSSIDSHGMGAVGNIQIDGPFFKIAGTVPTYLCYTIIESYLSSVIYELSEFYELTSDEDQISTFKKIVESSTFI